MMDEQFKDGLDQYGGDLDRWPPEAAAAARRLLAVSPTAQALLDETAEIERVLRESEAPPPSGLADRIFAAAFGPADEAEQKRPAAKGATSPVS